MSAVDDALALVSWAEPNAIALNDEELGRAVLSALSTRPGDEAFRFGVPLLRFVEADRPAVSLLDALVSDPRERKQFVPRCDHCSAKAQPAHRLWIPSGASVVELVVCGHHRAVLDDQFAGLVWR